MKVRIDGNICEIKEKELTVKDNKLYNTKTKEYEGVEGDLVSVTYEENGEIKGLRGTVGGYTCGTHVLIRPRFDFNNVKSKKIEHIMPVILIEKSDEQDEELLLMTEE